MLANSILNDLPAGGLPQLPIIAQARLTSSAMRASPGFVSQGLGRLSRSDLGPTTQDATEKTPAAILEVEAVRNAAQFQRGKHRREHIAAPSRQPNAGRIVRLRAT